MVEITEADKQAAFQRRIAYMGKHGHYEDPEALGEEIEALKRMLAEATDKR
jgi:hypothetical protein